MQTHNKHAITPAKLSQPVLITLKCLSGANMLGFVFERHVHYIGRGFEKGQICFIFSVHKL